MLFWWGMRRGGARDASAYVVVWSHVERVRFNLGTTGTMTSDSRFQTATEANLLQRIHSAERARSEVTSVPAPSLYSYELPGSQQAIAFGACYMLIEGFYGNILQDVEFDMCNLLAELATFSIAQIGSIPHFSTEGDGVATIGPLAAAFAERFPSGGPFTTSQQYFAAVGEVR
ncbi:hypothetical protein CC86DRAFT_416984 [Ophiobolus disseminans]|uniref:Uncharacterized protein n=1 Tax=Ophiobolus disseminans TaxID=1469910 RepID=A0A6A7A2Z4_9PLEO|nr:hypothetical protein CC86DRAFT_416984 [Ophiobolus disseminans]